jgi:hypothetical protein
MGDEPEASFRGRVGRDSGGRGAALGLVAVLAVAIGAAVVGRATAPEPSQATATESPSPAGASMPVVVAPTPSAEPCDPTDYRGPVPLLRLGGPTDSVGVRGLLGATRRPGEPDQPIPWRVPPPEFALPILPYESLHLILGTGDCLRRVAVVAAPAELDHAPTDADLHDLLTAEFEPPAESVVLGPLDALDATVDDWVLRVRASYWTGAGIARTFEVWSVLFFRVRLIRPPIVPPPTPAVTPAVACKFFAEEGDIGARLVVGGGEPVFGPAEATIAPRVAIPTSSIVAIILDGDGCAIEWTIEFLDQDGQLIMTPEAVANPDGDPDFAAQNRWHVQAFPVGASLLHVAYRSTGGAPLLEAWWRVSLVGGE